MQKKVNKFNEEYPVGTKVVFLDFTGAEVRDTIQARAWVFNSNGKASGVVQLVKYGARPIEDVLRRV